MRGFKVLVLCLVFLLVASLAIAGEVDVLIKKLVEKGVLTAEEAKAVLADTKESVKKQLADGKLDSVPAWAQNTKWAGDFRLRFEDRKLVQPAVEHNRIDRARLRLRYGFETKVNSEMVAGARLATGGSTAATTGSTFGAHPGSRDQTMEHGFDLKNIWLDLAYMTYSPKQIKNLKITGGKFAIPYYISSSLVWGAEITPEGVAIQYKKSIKPSSYPANIDYFLNLGAHPLHQGDGIAPVIYGMQGGASSNVFDRKLKAAFTYYYTANIKGNVYSEITPNNTAALNNSTSTGTSSGTFLYNYRVLALDAEYPIMDIILKLDKKKITLPLGIYGGWIKNVAADVRKGEGWLAGLKLGAAKDKGSWQISYDYRRTARDATLDFLNDAAFHAGGTNNKGYKISLAYMLLKDTTFTVNYYDTERLQGIKTAGEERDRLQLECLVKF